MGVYESLQIGFIAVTTIISVWKTVQSWRRANSLAEKSESLSMSNDTLKMIVAAIESLPNQSDAAKQIKKTITQISTNLDDPSVRDNIIGMVDDVESLFKNARLSKTEQNQIDVVVRALKASKLAKEQKASTCATSVCSIMLIFLIPIIIALTGCVETRLTSETIIPGNPNMIVIEWPEGTKVSDPLTVSVDGRIETVSPVSEAVK